VFRPAPQDLLAVLDVDPELGGYRHLWAEGGEAFSTELFIRERTVCLGGVEERDPAIEARPDQLDHLLLVPGRAVAVAHPHAAKADR
jgi:hypothetical protein